MPVAAAEEFIALALVFVVHVVGGGMLVWALLDADQRSGWRRRWRRGGDDDPPAPPSGGSDGDGGARVPAGLPLPGGGPSRVRLREPARAADRYQSPSRRPVHPAEPAPRRRVTSRESRAGNVAR